jgi:hypothetical protein
LATLSPPKAQEIPIRFNVVPLLPIVFLASIYPEKSAEVKKPPNIIQIYYGLILCLGIIKHGLKYPLSFAKPALTSPNQIYLPLSLILSAISSLLFSSPFRHLIEVPALYQLHPKGYFWILV